MRYRGKTASQIPPGARKTVHPSPGSGIGVFNVDGRYFAVKNTCPAHGRPAVPGRADRDHALAAAADGRMGMEWIREGEIASARGTLGV